MSSSVLNLYVRSELTAYPEQSVPLPLYSFGDNINLIPFNAGARSGSWTPDGITFPMANGSIDKAHFLYDFYYRIWIVPKTLSVRNPLFGVNIPFAIWNAYPYNNRLEEIVYEEISGFTLDTEVGNWWKPIEYKIVNITLDQTSPLIIDTEITFEFQSGQGTLHFTSERLPTIYIAPETPLTERWEYLTDVQIAVDGTENRIALRNTPRRTLTPKYIMMNREEIIDMQNKLFNDFAGQVVIPQIQYSAPLTENITAGSTALKINNAICDTRANEFVIIYDGTNRMLAKVSSLTSDGIIIDTPLSFSAKKGITFVSCAWPHWIDDSQRISRYLPNHVAEIELNVMSAQERSLFSRPDSPTVFTVFDGMIVLDKVPVYTSDEHSFRSNYERFDYGTGAIEQIKRWNFTRQEMMRQFIIHRYERPQDMDYWRDFFDSITGALKPFLMPSLRTDLQVTVFPADNSSIITVEGDYYFASLYAHEPFKRIWIETAGGVFVRGVTGCLLNDDNDTVLTLNDGLPSGQITNISFLYKVRLGSDTIELEHNPLDTRISFGIITVP